MKPQIAKAVVMHDAGTATWLRFGNPVCVLEARHHADVLPILREVEYLVNARDLVAAGFICYDAAPAFDRALTVRGYGSAGEEGNPPLIWFGLYRSAVPFRLAEASSHLASGGEPRWRPSLSRTEYCEAFDKVKAYIRDGHIYQVNLTHRLQTDFKVDPWAYFLRMTAAQNSAFGAFIETESWAICSASPELFLALEGRSIRSRPMKGTQPRAPDAGRDTEHAERLRESSKERAENVMIVDMVRNDLGRVATTGSVEVSELFAVEQYPTVWQLTSTVTATSDADFSEIIGATFPAASITGAPKGRAMEIIAEVEAAPRHLYTGSIGFMTPGRRAQFNVAIRTAFINKVTVQAEYGVGGGIVWDSLVSSEYDECQDKARILNRRMPEFSLLETLLWSPQSGYFLLDRHVRRLAASARYFDYSMDESAVRDALLRRARSLEGSDHRVRLLLAKDGRATIEVRPIARTVSGGAAVVCLARQSVDSSHVFLYHKTTQRDVYEQMLEQHRPCEDVILWNERGEVTESCVANVVVEIGGRLYTPPVRCGLLAGTLRAELLERGELAERIVTVEELRESRSVTLINSVRGSRPALLQAPDSGMPRN